MEDDGKSAADLVAELANAGRIGAKAERVDGKWRRAYVFKGSWCEKRDCVKSKVFYGGHGHTYERHEKTVWAGTLQEAAHFMAERDYHYEYDVDFTVSAPSGEVWKYDRSKKLFLDQRGQGVGL